MSRIMQKIINFFRQNSPTMGQQKKTKRIKNPYIKIHDDGGQKKSYKFEMFIILFICSLAVSYYLYTDSFKNQYEDRSEEMQERRVTEQKQKFLKRNQEMDNLAEILQVEQKILKIQSNKHGWVSLKVLNEGYEYHDVASKELQGIPENFQDSYLAQTYMSQQLKNTVRDTRYFDIHYFIEDDHTKYPVQYIYKAKKRDIKEVYEKRPILQIKKSRQELQQTIQNMMYPKQRPYKHPPWEVLNWQTQPIFDQTYYFYSLSNHPDNKDFLQAEFYRYEKLYNIGQYQKQLPICMVVVGKNDVLVVDKMYDSLRRQNYTNYRIVHIDDGSDDGTIDKVHEYMKQYPQFREKVAVISMRYKRNALFNRDWANRYFCQEGDIIVDMDADDWLIGNQALQLVNSLYQAGKLYRGKREELWAAYFTNILVADATYPYVVLLGEVDERYIANQTYRTSGRWRTTALRTYLWKIYNKIDQNDFVDQLMTKKGEHFVEAYDVFIQPSILQMSAPKHLRFLDQYVYFYTGYTFAGHRIKTAFVDTPYSINSARAIIPYNRMQTLDDTPTRNKQFKFNETKIKDLERMKKQVVERRQNLLQKIKDMYERDKKAYEEKKKVQDPK